MERWRPGGEDGWPAWFSTTDSTYTLLADPRGSASRTAPHAPLAGLRGSAPRTAPTPLAALAWLSTTDSPPRPQAPGVGAQAPR